MIAKLTGVLESRPPRGYVGKHRAPRHMRYVAAVPVPASGTTPEPEHEHEPA